jgi:murein DD-endopeptidase MepM/ murein hydrolase activator NlpD
MVAASAVAPLESELSAERETVIESLALDPRVPTQLDSQAYVRKHWVQRGDTLVKLFERLGVDEDGFVAAVRSAPDARPLVRQLRHGTSVTARINEAGELLSLAVPMVNTGRKLVIERDPGGLRAEVKPLAVERTLAMASGEIQSSLFAATDEIGLPDSVTIQVAEIFSGDIDFHRDLRRGDRFSVVYEFKHHEGEGAGAGRVVAAEFVNRGKTYRAFHFQTTEGHGGYYGPDGKNLRKAFLRSPIEFSRVTSGFSMRFHPILNTWRAHRGVDYAAAIGTTVRATADGVVEYAGWKNGYGNVVVLRHQRRHSTVYGHLNGFASGIRKGTRIDQGATIGYVGRTGMATGPHLHYEFQTDGRHQNPLTAVLPDAPPLASSQRAEFDETIGPLVLRLNLIEATKLAALD